MKWIVQAQAKKDLIKDNADQEDNNSYSKLAERQGKSYALC